MKSGIFGVFCLFGYFLALLDNFWRLKLKPQDVAQYVESLLKEAPQGDFEGNFYILS